LERWEKPEFEWPFMMIGDSMSAAHGAGAINEQMTVNEVVRLFPVTVLVFNDHAIDACCGGADPIREAALRDGADPEALLAELNRIVAENA
jgi:regulator of cell morphogenesis and NO signaling